MFSRIRYNAEVSEWVSLHRRKDWKMFLQIIDPSFFSQLPITKWKPSPNFSNTWRVTSLYMTGCVDFGKFTELFLIVVTDLWEKSLEFHSESHVLWIANSHLLFFLKNSVNSPNLSFNLSIVLSIQYPPLELKVSKPVEQDQSDDMSNKYHISISRDLQSILKW